MDAIQKSRGQNLNSPVLIPIYQANVNDVNWDSIDTMPIINVAKAPNNATGIRSTLDTGITYTDAQGMRVGMVCMVGNTVYRDIVTLIGTTNNGVVVRFDDEPDKNYTVRRSTARFVSEV